MRPLAIYFLIILSVTVVVISGCGREYAEIDSRFNLAQELLQQGDTKAASKLVNAAIAASPDRMTTYITAMELYRQFEELERAAEVGELLISRMESSDYKIDLDREQKLQIFLATGRLYWEADKTSQAAIYFEKALTLEPDNAIALNDIGYFYADEGIRLEEALRLTKRAAALAPDDGNIRDSLGWAYYKLGKYDAAVKELKKAVELEPYSGVIRYHLGAAYSKTGDIDRARVELEKAIALNSNVSEASKLLESLHN